jgi:hypothetical protein
VGARNINRERKEREREREKEKEFVNQNQILVTAWEKSSECCCVDNKRQLIELFSSNVESGLFINYETLYSCYLFMETDKS